MVHTGTEPNESSNDKQFDQPKAQEKDGIIADLTARLAAAEQERDEYKRLWKDACRVKDVRRVTAKGGRDE